MAAEDPCFSYSEEFDASQIRVLMGLRLESQLA
jgi:hypothetical protein